MGSSIMTDATSGKALSITIWDRVNALPSILTMNAATPSIWGSLFELLVQPRLQDREGPPLTI